MSKVEMEIIIAARKILTNEILLDIVSHSGEDSSFYFTGKILVVEGKVWHEFFVVDTDNGEYFATLRDDGTAIIAVDHDEVVFVSRF